MERKGFPESYDRRQLIEFVADVKSGRKSVPAPVYSHTSYDVVPDQVRVVERPDIVILEGLNVLQGGELGTYVSDYFDFSIYVDADPHHVERWYVDRFLTFRDTAFRDPDNYFHRYSGLSDDEARAEAKRIWQQINQPNLEQNIAPTRERATLILDKSADHSAKRVLLRRR